MPPEMEDEAKQLDWAAGLGIQLTLLATVVILARTSAISLHSIGLTASNWRQALAVGALFSVIPMVLLAVLRGVPGASENANPYPGVSPAHHFGLQVLAVLASESWRAFSIVALRRSGLPALAAVGIIAVVYAVPAWYQSGWSCAGVAVHGLILGFVFVRTDSLLAPLAVGLIAAGYARFLETRRAPTLLCPACGHAVQNVRTPGEPWIVCPGCQARLTVSAPLWAVSTGAAMGALATILYLVYVRGLDPVTGVGLLPPAFIAWVLPVAPLLPSFFPRISRAEIAPTERSLFHF